MDRLTGPQQQALRYGFAGLLLIVVSLKFMLQGGLDRHAPIVLNGEPAVLFFSLDKPCDCMQADVQRADEQMAVWKELDPKVISVYRIDFATRRELASQYGVRQTPSLVLVNSREEVVYQQDFPLFSEASFDLNALEVQIQALSQNEQPAKETQ